MILFGAVYESPSNNNSDFVGCNDPIGNSLLHHA
jgi:hypothetical protein